MSGGAGCKGKGRYPELRGQLRRSQTQVVHLFWRVSKITPVVLRNSRKETTYLPRSPFHVFVLDNEHMGGLRDATPARILCSLVFGEESRMLGRILLRLFAQGKFRSACLYYLAWRTSTFATTNYAVRAAKMFECCGSPFKIEASTRVSSRFRLC